MANQDSSGSSSGGTTDSTVQLNIKTLESQVYSFQVDKNILVSSFKDKIANEIGVPVGQQRLIFRGKVLKDDHSLSEYHVENGHTLHLVARQPAQSQDSSGTNAGESGRNNNHQANDPSVGGPRNRIGQISHSVVLGTFNVGDQAEGGTPDISQVIGAVLNSLGVGNPAMANVTGGMQATNMSNNTGTSPPGNGTEGTSRNVGSQSQTQAGNQARSGQAFPGQPFQSFPQVLQIPLSAAAVPLPTLNTPIQSSLTTIAEFMNRMEQIMSPNGNRSNTTPNTTEDTPSVNLPSNAQGLHTPEALSIVLRQAERLLSNQAVASLSHIAGRLEQERESTDPTTRGQIQAEAVRVGIAVQHLGALLLDLGRTLLTLRMGQSPAESVVNSGPSVYISPSGPNPIMAQPFPLQTSPLFSGSVSQLNPMAFSSAAIGTGPRNVNIHIHAGTSLAPMVASVGTRASNGDGLQGERTTGADSGASRMLPVRNIPTSAVPSHLSGVATSNAPQHVSGVSFSQPHSNPTSLNSLLAEVNSQMRSLVGQPESNIQNAPTPSVDCDLESDHRNRSTNTMEHNGDGQSIVTLPRSAPQERFEDGRSASDSKVDKDLDGFATSQRTVSHEENAPGSSKNRKEDAKAVPLGLGLGGLERKRHVKQQKPLAQSGDSGTTSHPSSQNQQARSNQQVRDVGLFSGQGSAGEPDMASVMSQVLHSPALNGLLSGVSEQTGVGSPNVLRNMLQQLTQSPQMRNVVNQIAQQVDTQEVDNMFTGMEGQGGGLDISRMFQQMMPIVSRALGASGATPTQQRQSIPQYSERSSNGRENNHQSLQGDVQSMSEAIEDMSAPEGVFRALVENSFQLSRGESGPGGVVDELCSNDDLINEYIDLLRTEMRQWFQDEAEQDRR